MALEWVEPFLAELRKSPNVARAARESGITREYAYQYREKDATFAAAWEDALAESTDELIGESYRRAKEGVAEPVFHEGQVCGHKQRYSDTLAIFLLKAHRPEVYGDKGKLELTGANGGPVQIYIPDNKRDEPGSGEPAG